MVRERWVCPKCGHAEDLLPGVSFYEHRYAKGIVVQFHPMKKEETK